MALPRLLIKKNNEYLSERLVENASKVEDRSARAVVDEVLRSVRLFSGGAAQSDDITMLALRYVGSGSSADAASDQDANVSITLENKMGELATLASALKSFGDASRISKGVMYDVSLVIEELFTNIVSYGYKDARVHTIKIDIRVDGREVEIQIEDDAIPFNPLEAPGIDAEKPLEERQIGGLGLHLVREMVDKISYERVDGKNVLNVIFKI